MQILVTGGTGLIGTALVQHFTQQGHKLIILTRNVAKASQLLPLKNIQFIGQLSSIKPTTPIEAVINLAGAPIAKPWSARYREVLRESRIDLTNQLVTFLKTLSAPPTALVSGSAVGFYGPQANNDLLESSAAVPSFSHELCRDWEGAANVASQLGIRVVNVRTGVVLSKRGGALAKMRLPFSLGLGGPVGTGNQWMSWVHLQDIVRIIEFCMLEQNLSGPVNATAPNPVTNKTFATTYGKVLHRPTILPMPAWLLRAVMGQMAEELLLTGQKVLPDKLRQAGFEFKFRTLEEALRDVEA